MNHLPATPLRVVLLATGLVLALAACSAAPEPDAGPVAAPDAADAAPAVPGETGPAPIAADTADDPFTEQQAACSAEPVQSLVGQEADEALVAQATALSGSTSVRVLKPGDAATMDYRGDRLNILTDDQGIVQSFNCG